MPQVTNTSSSGNQAIDSLVGDRRWVLDAPLTYGFPTTGSAYGSTYGQGEHQTNFNGLNVAQQNTARAAFQSFASVSNISFQELSSASAGSATLRVAMSDKPQTAYAYLPSTLPEGGDVWLNASSHTYDAPYKGNYAYATFLHEIGHTLGLEHPHTGGMPSNLDSVEYSVMSYRSYVGAPLTGYVNEAWGFPQSLMMYDIAAMQHMYGANYATNSGNTTYSWSPTTGEMFVNGSGQGAPGANRIFQTIWDGGGSDTYDFSNYSTNLTIDLRPGSWSTTSTAQLARLHYDGSQIADGNIANALLYGSDTRSLIESAYGGSGSDIIFGNQVGNNLLGMSGADSISGDGGADYILGGAGDDAVTGGAMGDLIDGGAGNDTLWGHDAFGGDGDDLINGGAGSDSIVGNLGSDRLYGGIESDAVAGGPGGDAIYGEDGDDTLWGHDGSGVGDEADYINGGNGNDTIVGHFGADQLIGEGGNDIIYGDDGNDFIEGGAGADRIFVGLGSDIINFTSPGFGYDDVYGFENGLDKFRFSTAIFANFSAVQSSLSDGSGYALIHHAGGQGDIAIWGVGSSALTADDFMFV